MEEIKNSHLTIILSRWRRREREVTQFCEEVKAASSLFTSTVCLCTTIARLLPSFNSITNFSPYLSSLLPYSDAILAVSLIQKVMRKTIAQFIKKPVILWMQENQQGKWVTISRQKSFFTFVFWSNGMARL